MRCGSGNAGQNAAKARKDDEDGWRVEHRGLVHVKMNADNLSCGANRPS
jgi:hypothetical protein